ncbi:MAG: hypothetical protein EXS52_00410 [Candidatus Staskawiczbacteria bacterium]|nr:hypothetical protein [Candidatus Staskawiczbacteria bacterium]
MADVSQPTQNLIQKYTLWKNSLKPKEGVPTVHVDEVASKVASFYEQIRTIIDWKEEHLMRRAAVIRKLKRRFLDLELNNFSKEFAELLVLELVRGGYFPNDRIEETKIKEVQKIIDKYVFILKNSPKNKKDKAVVDFYNKLLEIAACEIEETLAPSIKEMALIDYMFAQMQERIKINENVYQANALKKDEVDLQIYIAVQQSLFKLDAPIISYNILKYKYSQWDDPSEEDLLKIAQNIYRILQDIDYELSHPLGKRFYNICEKYDTPYLLLGDILGKDNIEETTKKIQEPVLFEEMIKKAYSKRLADLKTKIRRAAIYSTASIFITKILSLLILEVILAKILGGHLNFASLAADIMVPTLLMAILISTVKRPSKKNLSLAVLETMKITYQKEKTDAYEIKLARKKGAITKLVLSLIYMTGSAITLGFIYWVFNYFGFPLSSIIINIIFIALVLFTGTAIRTRSKELTIEEESAGVLGFISDVLLLPITSLGRWMMNKWKRYNAIVLFFNILIDMPFSAFIEFLERWRYFIKERKEDMR